jgi:purine-nucleoside phosphorylase
MRCKRVEFFSAPLAAAGCGTRFPRKKVSPRRPLWLNAVVQNVVARIRKLSPLRPALGLILGSGFQQLLPHVTAAARLSYQKLPGFPRPTVAGHAGELVIGRIAGVPVLILSGRAHYYEGYALEEVTYAVRVLAAAGLQDLLITNAAGGINRKFQAGDFMQVTDHVNFMGANPLRGPVVATQPRFVDLTQAYDPQLNRLLATAARSIRLKLHRGVYLAVSGPSYETPAEVRAFARLGADAVGMSTVPEVIVARQCGLRVAALSCVTNLAAGISKTPLSHQEVLETATRVQTTGAKLLTEFIKRYARLKT